MVDAFAIGIVAEAGLAAQPSKSKCYINVDHRPANWDELRGNIPEGSIKGDIGNVHHGITVCNPLLYLVLSPSSTSIRNNRN